ncbi:hypothetical protein EMIHUDRAFT_229480 [Emiliania huxleyi CCMP1516]|uniref:Uncharacterized protein n=2 Tax=Emiliania huxleyi TaxID=2903 RepID=A0A0D3KCS8_EMIH1|nr:hypothetical protein EMIHUDRAFT_229480 [Emiliania huxleyi CCMP1516]EOD33563.1 hypothetical protein EMIHUDRAFT_229480 [Emiliania huxleyi CCMP1516]|eukprot:XP_005785992.1 hypothetical protein EMIHUDRAFT_229480 [Emiliania huxleyi CCMP1516]
MRARLCRRSLESASSQSEATRIAPSVHTMEGHLPTGRTLRLSQGVIAWPQASYERQTKTIKRQVKYIAELQAQVQASTTELEEALAAASLAASKAAAAADGAAVDSVRRRQALMKPSIDVPFSVEATEGAPGQTTKLKEPVPGGPGYQAPLEFGAETPLPGREKEYADYKASRGRSAA